MRDGGAAARALLAQIDDTLAALNPRLIYCSITGFGQTGPYAARPGYDLLVQAMSGLMSITGQPDGEPGEGPLRVGVAVIDVFTGMYATTAILGALEARHHTGRGQRIDIALLDVAMAVLANQGAGYLNAGVVPARQGNVHPSVVPYQDFPTQDGKMLLAIGNDGQFARFCEVAEVDWARDARYATNSARVTHRATLIPMMNAVTRGKATHEWIALLEAASVPCGPINDIGQAFADEQVRHRGLRVEQYRYADGAQPASDPINRICSTASPLRLSDTPPTLRHAPPALGQHTDEVLRECLGLREQDVAALRARGVQ
ncbi:UNVERIFIED_CONTAM: CoA transferase [Microbacterium sp. SLM126]